MGQFSGTHISQTTGPLSFKFGMYSRVSYMKGIKYINLIEIGVVVIEIQGVENDELAVPVNKLVTITRNGTEWNTWFREIPILRNALKAS